MLYSGSYTNIKPSARPEREVNFSQIAARFDVPIDQLHDLALRNRLIISNSIK